MKSKLLIFLTLFLLSCSQPKLDERYVDIDFTNLSIHEFIEEVSKIIGKEIRRNENIEGKTNFYSNSPLAKDDLTSLLNAILEAKGMTLISKGDYYMIVKSSSVIFCGTDSFNYN